jgi:hypothetical protein
MNNQDEETEDEKFEYFANTYPDEIAKSLLASDETEPELDYITQAYEEAIASGDEDLIYKIELDFVKMGISAVIIGKVIKATIFRKRVSEIRNSNLNPRDYSEKQTEELIELGQLIHLLDIEIDFLNGLDNEPDPIKEEMQSIKENNNSIGDVWAVEGNISFQIGDKEHSHKEYFIGLHQKDNGDEIVLSKEDLEAMLNFIKNFKPE